MMGLKGKYHKLPYGSPIPFGIGCVPTYNWIINLNRSNLTANLERADSKENQISPNGRWFIMTREEFASYSFLAVTVSSVFLLCSGLLAIAFAW